MLSQSKNLVNRKRGISPGSWGTAERFTRMQAANTLNINLFHALSHFVSRRNSYRLKSDAEKKYQYYVFQLNYWVYAEWFMHVSPIVLSSNVTIWFSITWVSNIVRLPKEERFRLMDDVPWLQKISFFFSGYASRTENFGWKANQNLRKERLTGIPAKRWMRWWTDELQFNKFRVKWCEDRIEAEPHEPSNPSVHKLRPENGICERSRPSPQVQNGSTRFEIFSVFSLEPRGGLYRRGAIVARRHHTSTGAWYCPDATRTDSAAAVGLCSR